MEEKDNFLNPLLKEILDSITLCNMKVSDIQKRRKLQFKNSLSDSSHGEISFHESKYG